MNRPDSNSSDPSANQDDAVWLDLVARLQGDTPVPGADSVTDGVEPSVTETPGHSGGPRHTTPAGDIAAGDDAGSALAGQADGAGATDGGPGAESAAKRFTDFDPLGLAPRAPRELSAAERQQAAERANATEREKADGSGRANVAPGTADPRDYAVEDDDGGFVPEEPPKLSATDPLTMLAWLGAVGAPVALVLSSMFWRSAPLLAILGMVAVFVAAVVYLIMKLPQEKDENDDGARV